MKKRIVVEHSDADLQKRFKIECMKEGKSMTEKIYQWIRSYVSAKKQPEN